MRVRVLLNLEKTEMGDPFSTGEKEMMKHDPHIDHDPCMVVLVDDESLARHVLEVVRDVDVTRSRRFFARDLRFRVRRRDPRTLLLLSRRVL